MTNKQIIRAAAERLNPATLHQIATAHHTPEEIAAVAASCKIVDKDGNEKPATAADIEIMFAADELHTFDFWKKEGKSVKKGEKALLECYLWKYTTKPSKEQREKAAAEGKEAAPDPHYYPTKSHLFSCLQVESSRPAPQARFKSTAEIIAYNAVSTLRHQKAQLVRTTFRLYQRASFSLVHHRQFSRFVKALFHVVHNFVLSLLDEYSEVAAHPRVGTGRRGGVNSPLALAAP